LNKKFKKFIFKDLNPDNSIQTGNKVKPKPVAAAAAGGGANDVDDLEARLNALKKQ
jgi:hypothetical protein